jgi:hypothetical protein
VKLEVYLIRCQNLYPGRDARLAGVTARVPSIPCWVSRFVASSTPPTASVVAVKVVIGPASCSAPPRSTKIRLPFVSIYPLVIEEASISSIRADVKPVIVAIRILLS